MIVLFVVVLVVFGPQKLPELARGLGKLMAEFRKASTDFKSAFEEEMREMERHALQAERKKAADAAVASVAAEASPAAIAVESSGTESQTGETFAEGGPAEQLVISPVAEAVPRASEEPAEVPADSTEVTKSLETSHDSQHPA